MHLRPGFKPGAEETSYRPFGFFTLAYRQLLFRSSSFQLFCILSPEKNISIDAEATFIRNERMGEATPSS